MDKVEPTLIKPSNNKLMKNEKPEHVWPDEPPNAPPPGPTETDKPDDGREDEKIIVPIVR